jgi:DNA-directed RNA polymerase specialized sigma24 family protein
MDDLPDGDDGDQDDSDQDGGDKTDDEDDGADDKGGEGHGDGEGTDDGNPDDEEEGPSSGAAEEEESGDDNGTSLDTGQSEGLEDPGAGRTNKTLVDALKMLEANQRRALFLYKKRKQTVPEIAAEMNITEDQTRDLLRDGRRRLNEILNGG